MEPKLKMKTGWAIIFICIVSLLIIGKKSHVSSRVLKRMKRQSPQPTPQNDSTATQWDSWKLLDVLSFILPDPEGNYANLNEEQEKGEMSDNSGRKHVLLMASTRTGSSFLGELFNQHGENMFYLFEPLWHVEFMLRTIGEADNETALTEIYRDVLQALLLCDFSSLEKFISPPPENHVTPDFFRRESSLSLCEESVCSPVNEDVSERYPCETRSCGPLNLTLASQSCLSKQHHAIKTVRVKHLDTLQPLLQDPRLDVRVIQLVRDPRAIVASRMVAFSSQYQMWNTWANGGQVPEDSEEFIMIKEYCDQVKISVEMALSQPLWLRGRYMLVRFEDIARYPMQKAEEMYKFAEIPFSSQVTEWILKNTKTDLSGLFFTQRISSEQVDKWRFTFPFALAQVVQKACGPTMKMLGYKFVNDKKTLINKSVSLVEDKPVN